MAFVVDDRRAFIFWNCFGLMFEVWSLRFRTYRVRCGSKLPEPRTSTSNLSPLRLNSIVWKFSMSHIPRVELVSSFSLKCLILPRTKSYNPPKHSKYIHRWFCSTFIPDSRISCDVKLGFRFARIKYMAFVVDDRKAFIFETVLVWCLRFEV